ncbi:hypothetical protein [Parasphingorhabdus sp.]
MGEGVNLAVPTTDDLNRHPRLRRQSENLRSGRRWLANFLETADNHIAAVCRSTMVGGVVLEFRFVNPAQVIQA